MQNSRDVLKAEVIQDICLSLGLVRPPAFLSKAQVAATNIRTESSLESDKKKGYGPLLPIEVGGVDRWRLSDVVKLAITQRLNGKRQMSVRKLAAIQKNLEKANEARRLNMAQINLTAV